MTTADELRARFERILVEHGPGLGRVARVYAHGRAERADLAQEIAVALWRALPDFRGESSERTFVYRIAHNRGVSHAEARRARERVTATVDPRDVNAAHAADPKPAADEALDAARRRDALFEAIAALPLGARAVLTLALEGMTHEEIADVLGSSANSVAVRLSRARAELRSKMEKWR
jgi:RNA polymerase sigma-70 factor (ECF subfamily)